MDDELKQRPENQLADGVPGPGISQEPREQLLSKLIVGQTIGATALTVMTAIGGLFLPDSTLFALTPLGATAVIVGLISYWLLKRRQFRLAGYVFTLGTILAITAVVVLRGYQDASALYYLWPAVSAVMILGARGGILATATSAVIYLALVVVQELGLQPVPLPYDPQTEALLTVGSRVIMLFLLAFLAWLSGQSVDRVLQQVRQAAKESQELAQRLSEVNETLEQRVTERTRGLQAAGEVSRATTAILDPDELMRQTVDLVRERFDLYYVGLFLVDEERQFAVLRAGTGEAGQLMLAQGHGLTVGGDSMIGRCISGDEAIIALDVGEEAVRFDNPLLPKTRSEMALPMRSRGQVIGAMTVQSAQEAAFDETDVTVMQNVTDQVGAAIDNARLYAQIQAALREAEIAQRQYLGREWVDYATRRVASGYQHARDRAIPLSDETLPEVQWTLQEQRPLVLDGSGDGSQGEESHPAQLVVPIVLSGQPIGALGIRDPQGKRRWSEEDIALAQAVAEQLGLAAENLRLLEQTQRRAAREQLTRQITDNIRAAVDVEDALQRAIRELGRVLGASEMIARLGTERDLLSSSWTEGEENTP